MKTTTAANWGERVSGSTVRVGRFELYATYTRFGGVMWFAADTTEMDPDWHYRFPKIVAQGTEAEVRATVTRRILDDAIAMSSVEHPVVIPCASRAEAIEHYLAVLTTEEDACHVTWSPRGDRVTVSTDTWAVMLSTEDAR